MKVEIIRHRGYCIAKHRNGTMILKYSDKSYGIVMFDGVDIDSEDSDGRSMFCDVASRGNTFVVKILLEAGADINHMNSITGLRPIHYAVMNKRLDMVKFLVGLPVELDCKIGGSHPGPTNNGKGVMGFAESIPNNSEVCQYLVYISCP